MARQYLHAILATTARWALYLGAGFAAGAAFGWWYR